MKELEAAPAPATPESVAPIGRSLGLKTLGFDHIRVAPGGRLPMPEADPSEEAILFVLEGEAHVVIDGRAHVLQPGDAIAAPAQAFAVANPGQGEVRFILAHGPRGEAQMASASFRGLQRLAS
ncbi:MAG: cupin domain-containing protein [Caulobacterales bacterium]